VHVFADRNGSLPLVQQNDAEVVNALQLVALMSQVLQTSAENVRNVRGAMRLVHVLMQPIRLLDS
jgi:hypothetical protein